MFGITIQLLGIAGILVLIVLTLDKILKELEKKNKRDEMFDKANSDSRRTK
jgi:heme exporter protein D